MCSHVDPKYAVMLIFILILVCFSHKHLLHCKLSARCSMWVRVGCASLIYSPQTRLFHKISFSMSINSHNESKILFFGKDGFRKKKKRKKQLRKEFNVPVMLLYFRFLGSVLWNTSISCNRSFLPCVFTHANWVVRRPEEDTTTQETAFFKTQS